MSEELKGRIEADLAAAMKAKQEPDRTVLRSVLSAIHNQEIIAKADLDEAGVTDVLRKQVKQREEAAEAASSRPELQDKEKAEAAIIAKYLPTEMNDDELGKLVDEAIAETGASGMSDMGKVMGALKAKLAGRADPGKAAGLVKAKLG